MERAAGAEEAPAHLVAEEEAVAEEEGVSGVVAEAGGAAAAPQAFGRRLNR